jgi:hypothetical protein
MLAEELVLAIFRTHEPNPVALGRLELGRRRLLEADTQPERL